MLPGAPTFSEAQAITTARSVASRLAASALPILIMGEVGTGRRTLAAAVADLRARSELKVIVASAFDGLPEELRARGDRPAVLVLHHVQALDARGQSEVAALVRDHRVLLVAMGKTGDAPLGPDLAALLDATQVTLPPLRDRGGDAANWADTFVARAASELGCAPPKLSAEAQRAVGAHTWPGNLSELESVVRRAVLLGQAAVIEPGDLGFTEKLVVQSLNDAVEEFRMSYVAKVLAHFAGNRTQAAKALGIDPRTMFRYLAKGKQDGS